MDERQAAALQRLERKADRSIRPNDAQLALEVLITLPSELNTDQRRLLMTGFSRDLSRKGLIVDVSIQGEVW
jgi:hypothetical protein